MGQRQAPVFRPASRAADSGRGGCCLAACLPPLIAELELDDSIAISRLSVASRDKPVDAGGRVTGKLIDQLITGLLDVTGIAPSSIKSVMLTTDHRANYLAEALEGLGQSFEHLDPIKDCPAIGATVGELSPISGFVALACARARVLATGNLPCASVINILATGACLSPCPCRLSQSSKPAVIE
jgi:hypothetical protein